MNFKKLKCFFLGHKMADDMDSGYCICHRCGAHEFYDGRDNGSKVWENTIPYKWAMVRWKVYWFFENKIKPKIYVRCGCGKLLSIFTIPLKHKDSNDCLPF